MSLLDKAENDEFLILILDLIEGGELFDAIADHGELSEAQASCVFRTVAAALDHLHRRNIAHLDVKPENLILEREVSWQLEYGVPALHLSVCLSM